MLHSRYLPQNFYVFLFALLGVVYVLGLFVPLMDNDAAHHANIAMHMYLTRDFVSLVDYGKDYLDKPHLHFWLVAFSYKIFGVTTFAYKFPSLLFTILGIYSTYRLGKSLYDQDTGKLAALILASAFAFILANNDVRMDAILTACIAFATWQGVDFIRDKKIINALGLAFGLALGFSTKGHIAVLTPAIGLFFFILYKRDWKILMTPKWLIVLVAFAIFIFPVVYCYYLQFNLHPEKVVRGKDHINGVRFILLGQSIDRFSGEFGNDAKSDWFFFFHSFLWAFAPWSLVAFIAAFARLQTFRKRKEEWLTIGTFITIALLVTASSFKLPHYLNIIFPSAAVMCASWMLNNSSKPKTIYVLQIFSGIALLLVAAIINAWAFPVTGLVKIICVVMLLALSFYILKKERLTTVQKSISFSVSVMILLFFLLNANFYRQLLRYQGGNELSKKIKGNVDPANIYYWKENYSSSFGFYTATERKPFHDSIFTKGKRPIWLLFDSRNLDEIKQAGYTIQTTYCTDDFEITRLDIKFINPSTRKKFLASLCIGEIAVKQ